jgi:tetratricopeptide (TPR) repeat protein
VTGEFSRGRRFGIALTALLLAGLAFRPQIADALIVRGDDYVYRGDSVAALERYRRALAIWPASQTAADRYVFLNMQLNTARSLHDGIDVATRYLSHRPGDAPILSDRALCYLREKRYALAQADFERAAMAQPTAQSYAFAGWAAQRAGRHRAALWLWKLALRMQPHYRPALIALAEHPG